MIADLKASTALETITETTEGGCSYPRFMRGCSDGVQHGKAMAEDWERLTTEGPVEKLHAWLDNSMTIQEELEKEISREAQQRVYAGEPTIAAAGFTMFAKETLRKQMHDYVKRIAAAA